MAGYNDPKDILDSIKGGKKAWTIGSNDWAILQWGEEINLHWNIDSAIMTSDRILGRYFEGLALGF